jgi:hypothetical protein
MKKIFVALSIALAGCAPGGILSSPAPLTHTTIDEKTLIVALQTFDTVLTAVNKLIAAKVIVPGTPRAIAIADAIHKAKVAYQAASFAQRAGSSANYLAALDEAQTALGTISSLVKGN